MRLGDVFYLNTILKMEILLFSGGRWKKKRHLVEVLKIIIVFHLGSN